MPITVAESLFIDTNILVFANVAEAPLHKAALDNIKKHKDSGCNLWISSQVLREYIAVRSRHELFSRSSHLGMLIERVRFFESAFNVAYDNPSTLENLLMLIKKVPVGGKQIHDANIVATMLSHGIQHLLTDNVEDFERFSKYIKVIPLRSQQ